MFSKSVINYYYEFKKCLYLYLKFLQFNFNIIYILEYLEEREIRLAKNYFDLKLFLLIRYNF